MKTLRHNAVAMADALATLALGEMDAPTLETTMMNYDALKKAKDDFDALKSELFKRLYGDVEKMDDEQKKELQSFFDALTKVKDDETAESVKSQFPTLFDKRMKEMQVLTSLLNKEIEVEITKVDETAFVSAIVKGNKGTTMREISRFFAPLFNEKEKKEADLSELDELLK